MAITYKNLQDLILNQVDESNSGTRDDVKVYINMSGRDLLHARPWDFRRVRAFVSTTTPYATGTATFTNGSTTLTGSGTTWTSAMVGRKVATAYGAPYYIVSAYVSATELTIADDYDGTTVAGSAYVIYDDRVTLAANVGELEAVWLQRPSQASQRLEETSERVLDAINHIPTRTSHPRGFVTEPQDTYRNKVIRLAPFAPDAEYRIEYIYLKKYVDMNHDADLCSIPEHMIDAVIHKTLSWVYKREHYQRAQSELQQYEHALNKAWTLENNSSRGPKMVLSRRPQFRGDRTRYTLDS